MEIEKIENVFEKPIHLVKLFSTAMIVDLLSTILYKTNLFQLFKKNNISTDKIFSIIFASLITCFFIKIFLGVLGRKFFFKYGNYHVYNEKGTIKTIEDWQKEAYKVNNQYAINKLNRYKQSLEIEANCFTDIFINTILFVIYLFSSLETRTASLCFLTPQAFFICTIIVYFIILGIILYTFLNNKNKMIIDL